MIVPDMKMQARSKIVQGIGQWGSMFYNGGKIRCNKWEL